ncbi:MAG: thioredoxin family protein [Myxococcales bacterium]|nr:thioredoxin family protein [Myxococcales bacterium]
MEGFVYYLAIAFVGGVVLNIMPCVLPVLTMKVFHLVEQVEASAATQRRHGLAYGAGVLATFAVLGGALVALQAAGSRVGWGMQFGDARFVAVMTTVIFAFALNALGVFELSVSVGTRESSGYWGSLVNGVVASIMSTPCSAPFLGSAAGFALGGAAPWQTMVIFVTIGVGLAAPFVLFSFVPGASRLLPRPGLWMETFKQLMGFSLIATAAWLLGVVMKQNSVDAAIGFVRFLVVVAVAAWAVGRFGSAIYGSRQRLAVLAIAVAMVGGGAFGFVRLEPPAPAASSVAAAAALDGPAVVDDRIAWREFDSEVVMASLAAGRPVFMDYTADWCMNCKTNERLFIETPEVRAALVESGVLPMQADLTVENEEIRSWLEPFPYSGIPVYVVYLPDQTYDLLPQVITTQLVVSRLQAAASRFPQ